MYGNRKCIVEKEAAICRRTVSERVDCGVTSLSPRAKSGYVHGGDKIVTQSECIFCRIAAGEVPAEIVWQDEQVVAFKDINPQAPVHVVIIPRKHVSSLAGTTSEDTQMLGAILGAAKTVATEQGVSESGYRVVTNCGPDALQTVQHLHFHVLGGRRLGWPPG